MAATCFVESFVQGSAFALILNPLPTRHLLKYRIAIAPERAHPSVPENEVKTVIPFCVPMMQIVMRRCIHPAS